MLKSNLLQEKVKLWTESDYFDKATQQEILNITDEKELEDRFCCDLEFGTAGMRGIMGAGTNRLNIYVIRRLIQGLADMIKERGDDGTKRGVVIAYDCRHYSPEFAKETALVLGANGIKAYLFESLRPTPLLSFAVRHLKTIAGIMITASHNPKEYNGCKVYWEDGGQILADKTQEIVAKIAERNDWNVQTIREEEAIKKGLLVTVGPKIDLVYLEEIKKQLLNKELTQAKGKNLKIVFTPLHGTGHELVPRILEEIGFSSLVVVPEQAQPDGSFCTVKIPNPEDPVSCELALGCAIEDKADLIFSTDPDADRMGVLAKEKDCSYKNFTGNEIGVILQYYLLSQRKKNGTLPLDGVVMKSIASTDLADAIALDYGVKLRNVLVGFKYIGEQIKIMEKEDSGTYLFGFEESHGYLAGTYARDKDAVQGIALMAEAALYFWEEENKTLIDVLEDIHQIYGYYLDEQVALTFEGLAGKKKIELIMENLRQEQRRELGGLPLKSIEDYLTGQGQALPEGRSYSLELPEANVLRFSFEQGGYVMARPSGTEPKIRFYFCVRGDSPQAMKETLKKVKKDFFLPLSLV